ncbi:glutathione S-transferase [Trichonephila inaurata madagascariensis]|uniref:glutathione transferase n=1 Tax=Trichonephila inaurata madagascariensis TaxID=2747483 RepID=A0A8X6WTX3_9ARAC|nr:glutathione S-transferase [Trichonephila inaurata madagascariensis]
MVKSTLGYWNIRGLAQPIRYLLHHEKEDFEDRRYLFTDNTWQNEKYALGLDFPNLPYYIDGDTRITQSTAILRYLGGNMVLMEKTSRKNFEYLSRSSK